MRCPVLVFGGTGLIGSHAVRALHARGTPVTIAGRTAPAGSWPEGAPKWIACDIANVDEVKRAFRLARPRRILHLAAALQFACDADPPLAVDVNINGTRNILAAARDAGVSRVVFASSVAVYGARFDRMHEDDPPSAASMSLYGAAKWFEERLGIEYAKQHGLSFVALRYCAVFGAGGSQSRGMALVRRTIAEARGGCDVAIADASGDERAQLTYVDDAVDITLRALDVPSPRHFVYNVAGPEGNHVTLHEYCALVAELFPNCGHVHFHGRARDLGPVDTSRACTDLGFVPKISVRDGLIRMFAGEAITRPG